MKTTSYELYRTRQSSLAKTALEITKRQNPDMLKPLKKLRDEQITRLLLRAQPQFMQSLDSVIIAEELLWEREGCPVIFPQSAEFLDKLLDAKFDLSKAGGFELPFPAFMIPMPSGFQREGVKIRGILVTSYPVIETNDIFDHYAHYLNTELDSKMCMAMGIDPEHKIQFGDQLDELLSKGLQKDDWLLNICLVDNKDSLIEQATIRASEAYRRIPDLLKSKTVQEFDERLGHIDVSYRSQEVKGDDAKYQRRANNQRVQAGDILLVIKGSVTKVGYVPKDCPDNWIAGQSFLILRPSPKIGTEYLFQYLNSELVQGYLKERTLGEVMTIIKAADVESIPVPLPEPRELKAVRDTHEQIQAEYAAIEQHRQVIGQLKSTLWSLPN